MSTMEYNIQYQIHEDQLISAVVQVDNREEHYLGKYEIDMLIAEWVHNNWRYMFAWLHNKPVEWKKVQ